MANRPTVPNWSTENLNKPNEYTSQFLVNGNRYVNVTDVSTGQRWLYSVGIGGSRTLISSTTANGVVTTGPGFAAVSSQYPTLNASNKNQSQFIIQRVSTAEEKTTIGSGSEYKSIFGNTVRTGVTTTGITTSTTGISTDTSIYIPDYNNPIIERGVTLRYPKNMDDDQDRILFTAVEIIPRTDFYTQGGANLGNLGNNIENQAQLENSFSAFQIQDPQYNKIAGSVEMSIQSPIQEQTGVDWSPDSINAIDALLYNASTALIGEASSSESRRSDANTSLNTTMNSTVAAAKSNVGRLQRMFAGQAAGVNNILARTDGVILNPNLELIFQGVQLRPFSFTFKMSARSKEEGDDIKTIIKYFKRHMAPRKESGIFLKAPHVFTITYQKGSSKQLHPSIGIISPTDTKRACALTSCTVDYTPLGSYMTFNDEEATMIAYTISLQFQELQPIYDKDYAEGPGFTHSIGY